MSHVYDGRERPDSGPYRRPDDYSVAIWKYVNCVAVQAYGKCFGYCQESLDTRLKAGQYALNRAVKEGLLKPGDRYDVDVSEDASDEWETVLTGTVASQLN